jgi:glutamine kinase
MGNQSKLSDNIFTSKANVLFYLESKIRKSKIENLYIFTLNEWSIKKSKILNDISNLFESKIIIRSSAIGEDSVESSEAGKFESYLNINSKSKKNIEKTISKVIRSYKKKESHNNQNQVLIQNQTKNIVTSGVIFSRTPDIGSPYFIINYEDGGSTVGVTQGSINNIIKIFRNSKNEIIPKKWKALINAMKELEQILENSSLDVEFGISKTNKIIIFQVRPITSINSIDSNLDLKIEKIIKKLQLQFTKAINSKNDHIFSDMADWNPAEIIGNNPNPLDYSLYDFLIMKNAWYKGRVAIGYQKPKNNNLMVKFGNKPYVDIEQSFYSLIPSTINKHLSKKLMKFCLKKLISNPELHDKVEFEILVTCYDVLTRKKLKTYNFSNKEIHDLEKALIEFTNNIFLDFRKRFDASLDCIQKMNINRKITLKKLENSKQDYKILLNASENLLTDCKKFGTIQFSSMARISFITSTILRSLVKSNHVNQKFVDDFMNTLTTPLSEFRDIINDYSKHKISKKSVLKKYGHLRPGTYDILAKRYDEQNDFLDQIKFEKIKKPVLIPPKNLLKILEKNHHYYENDFLTIIKNSLIIREQLKFEFTKNLSDALQLIIKAGKKLNFSREDLSFLEINYIFRTYKKYGEKELIKKWESKIKSQKMKKTINDYLILPPMIFSKQDFEIISYYHAKPNYITSKYIVSEIINLKKSSKLSLNNKIILLENADPGFDWIFAENPSGLITKYGGAASHMAIRCGEIGLPAAIGCGELIFDELLNSQKILLDCKNEKITVLENQNTNKFIEERKILKSLGYIK